MLLAAILTVVIYNQGLDQLTDTILASMWDTMMYSSTQTAKRMSVISAAFATGTHSIEQK